MGDTIAERTAIRLWAARDRPRNAHELGPHFIGAEPDRCIAVTAEIDELEMRGEARVRERASTSEVEVLCVIEARADASAEC